VSGPVTVVGPRGPGCAPVTLWWVRDQGYDSMARKWLRYCDIEIRVNGDRIAFAGPGR
jgi:hypothetical protein